MEPEGFKTQKKGVFKKVTTTIIAGIIIAITVSAGLCAVFKLGETKAILKRAERMAEKAKETNGTNNKIYNTKYADRPVESIRISMRDRKK